MAAVSQVKTRSRSRSGREDGGPAFIDDLVAMAASLANGRKAYAAAQLQGIAESVRQFSASIADIPTVKAYSETAAESLDDLADYLVEREVLDMIDDAREFSRHHPLIMLGGSIAAGLVITQLVQARAQLLRSGRRSPQPGATGRSRGAAKGGRAVKAPLHAG